MLVKDAAAPLAPAAQLSGVHQLPIAGGGPCAGVAPPEILAVSWRRIGALGRPSRRASGTAAANLRCWRQTDRVRPKALESARSGRLRERGQASMRAAKRTTQSSSVAAPPDSDKRRRTIKSSRVAPEVSASPHGLGHAYAGDICFAEFMGWPCTARCARRSSQDFSSGTCSDCADRHVCRHKDRPFLQQRTYGRGPASGPIMSAQLFGESSRAATLRTRKIPSDARFCRHFCAPPITASPLGIFFTARCGPGSACGDIAFPVTKNRLIRLFW
eukprot:COSAG01_NODE_1563_length_9897_cov_10.242703_2_plen_273_part_00